MIDFGCLHRVGITSALRRHCIGLFVGVSMAATQGQAQEAGALTPWLEMAAVCEAALVEQQIDGLAPYRDAPTYVNVGGFPEHAVRHGDAAIHLSIVSNASEWFVCTVRTVEPVLAATTQQLIDGWSRFQMDQGKRHGHELIDQSGNLGSTRVLCHDAGRITVVFAFLHDDHNDFRIGVTNSLPSGVANPCTDGGIQDNA